MINTDVIERAFVGAILKDSKNMEMISSVDRDWFMDLNMGLIFETMRSLYAAGNAIDKITLRDRIYESNANNRTFAIAEISELLENSDIVSQNFESYKDKLEAVSYTHLTLPTTPYV